MKSETWRYLYCQYCHLLSSSPCNSHLCTQVMQEAQYEQCKLIHPKRHIISQLFWCKNSYGWVLFKTANECTRCSKKNLKIHTDSLSLPFPSSSRRSPLFQIGGLGEHSKLLQQSPNRKWFWCIFALKSYIWCNNFNDFPENQLSKCAHYHYAVTAFTPI